MEDVAILARVPSALRQAILARVPSAPRRDELNNRAKHDTIILNFQFSILNYSKRRSQWKS